MILVFILFSFFIVGEILQPSGGHVQGKGSGDTNRRNGSRSYSYDNTRSKWLNFLWNEMVWYGILEFNVPLNTV